jgi:hypothetical protein
MKKETLEEAAIEYSIDTQGYERESYVEAFTEGAKYQAQRMYSEEEVLDILESYKDLSEYDGVDFSQWFEQFKKK